MTFESSSIKEQGKAYICIQVSSLFDQISGVVGLLIMSYCLSSLARLCCSLHYHSLCHHCLHPAAWSLSPSLCLSSLPTPCWYFLTILLPVPFITNSYIYTSTSWLEVSHDYPCAATTLPRFSVCFVWNAAASLTNFSCRWLEMGKDSINEVVC